MLERFLEQNEIVTTMLCWLSKNNLCLSAGELALLQSSINVLEIFEEVMREMSSETTTSLSKVILMIRGTQACTRSVAEKDGVHELGHYLQAQMKQRFAIVEGSLNRTVSILLDPRFQKAPFSDSSNVKTVEDQMVNQMRSD